MPVIRTALLIACLFAAGACGQSGPLYLPGNPGDVEQEPAQPGATEDGDQSDEDDGAT